MEMSVFELLAIARERADADYVKGDRILCEKRYATDTEHMLEFRVLGGHEPYGSPGDHCRLFLTDEAYRQMREKERQKKIRVIRYARVRGSTLAYGPPAERPAFKGEEPLPAGKKSVRNRCLFQTSTDCPAGGGKKCLGAAAAPERRNFCPYPQRMDYK